MKFKTRRFIVKAVALTLVLMLLAFFAAILSSCGNRTLIDTTYTFDRAIIYLPDGSSIEGKVEQWCDYESSDMLQVKINGIWYLTHSANVLLIAD